MLYREIIAVCSESHTKHTNAAVRQKVGIFNVKPGGTYSDLWGCKVLVTPRFINLQKQAYHKQCKTNTVMVGGGGGGTYIQGKESIFGDTDMPTSRATLIRMRLYTGPRRWRVGTGAQWGGARRGCFYIRFSLKIFCIQILTFLYLHCQFRTTPVISLHWAQIVFGQPLPVPLHTKLCNRLLY